MFHHFYSRMFAQSSNIRSLWKGQRQDQWPENMKNRNESEPTERRRNASNAAQIRKVLKQRISGGSLQCCRSNSITRTNTWSSLKRDQDWGTERRLPLVLATETSTFWPSKKMKQTKTENTFVQNWTVVRSKTGPISCKMARCAHTAEMETELL